MLKLLREIHQFLVDCPETPQDDEESFKRQQQVARGSPPIASSLLFRPGTASA